MSHDDPSSKTNKTLSWRDLIGHYDCNTRSWAEVMGWRAFAKTSPVASKTVEQIDTFWTTLESSDKS
jgi:hypothetical protein